MAQHKLQHVYDVKANRTLCKLGKKRCWFEGKPSGVKLKDAEFLLRQARR